jgi:glucose-1-phosphate cytidylyltransferase
MDVAILCGGRGTRLKPTTDTIPKALVPLNGRPILDYVLEFYARRGFRHFTLCVGYKSEAIRAHYTPAPDGLQITFSDAGEAASMLERIWALRDGVDDTLIVSYGDTFIDLDLERLLAHHRAAGAEATIVTAKIRSPFGLVRYDGSGQVTSFVEKPLLNYYIGSFLVEKAAFARMTPELLALRDGQGLVAFFAALIGLGKLHAFEHGGNQITFNTESERAKAEEDMGKFYTYSEDE